MDTVLSRKYVPEDAVMCRLCWCWCWENPFVLQARRSCSVFVLRQTSSLATPAMAGVVSRAFPQCTEYFCTVRAGEAGEGRQSPPRLPLRLAASETLP